MDFLSMNLLYISHQKVQNFLVYLILLNHIEMSTSLQSMTAFVLSKSGHHVTDHDLISKEKTSSILECAQFCLRKICVCKSISYKTRKNKDSAKNCQLNNSTRSSNPQNFKINPDYNYYEPLIKEEHKKKYIKPEKQERSCDELYKSGKTTSGVYTIKPDCLEAFQVRCDINTTQGKGWTVFQRRVDGSVDFYRNWADYKNGFGNLEGEFWLGLDKIHRLTASGQNVLRVDLETFENETAYANYALFSVGDESQNYALLVGEYSGNAGDGLAEHNGMKFSTKDRDNDLACSQTYKGAWWYKSCHFSNLNGQYLRGHHGSIADGVNWVYFKGNHYSLKTSEMKVRPAI